MDLLESHRRNIGKNEEEPKRYLDFELLLASWEEMKEACYDRIYKASTPEEKERGFAAMHKETEELVLQLIAEKERFSRVFETERGSVYFQIEGGSTARFKIIEAKVGKAQSLFEYYSIQMPTDALFFLEPQVAEEFMNLRQSHSQSFHSQIINREFKTADYQTGVQPIEFILDNSEYYEVVKTSDGFKILPKKDIPNYFEPALPNHVGNKITKIHK